jgi:hypothetical protein
MNNLLIKDALRTERERNTHLQRLLVDARTWLAVSMAINIGLAAWCVLRIVL